MPTYPRLVAWLLIPVPLALCAAIMYSSLLISRIGWIHLSLISIVPWACGFGGGMLVSAFLVRSKALYILMVMLYGLATIAVMGLVGRTLPNPFP